MDQPRDDEAAMRPVSYAPRVEPGAKRVISQGTMFKHVGGHSAVRWGDTESGLEVWAIPYEMRAIGIKRYCRCTVAEVTETEVRVLWAPRDAVKNELPNQSIFKKKYWLDPQGACPRIESENNPQKIHDRVNQVEKVTQGSILSGVGVGDAFSRKPHAMQPEDVEHDNAVRSEWAQAVVDEDELPEPTTPQRPAESGIGTFGTADKLGRATDDRVPGPGQYSLGHAHSTGMKALEGGRISTSHLGKRGQNRPSDNPDPHSYRPGHTLTRPASPSALCYLTG